MHLTFDLVVALHGFADRLVNDVTHVGFVNAEPKSSRRTNYSQLAGLAADNTFPNS